MAESPRGVAIQIYSALIAALMLQLLTGKRPGKREMEMLRIYLMGYASLEENIALLGFGKKQPSKNSGEAQRERFPGLAVPKCRPDKPTSRRADEQTAIFHHRVPLSNRNDLPILYDRKAVFMPNTAGLTVNLLKLQNFLKFYKLNLAILNIRIDYIL